MIGQWQLHKAIINILYYSGMALLYRNAWLRLYGQQNILCKEPVFIQDKAFSKLILMSQRSDSDFKPVIINILYYSGYTDS